MYVRMYVCTYVCMYVCMYVCLSTCSPVFVWQLHTRETWLKEGRVVRRGEKAYKMVKARTKRVSNNCVILIIMTWFKYALF